MTEAIVSGAGSSDAALMAAIRVGDVDALGVLFTRHAPAVHALCYRLTRDADSADDLTQETFLRVLDAAASFRGDARFTTWLHRIAWNATVDHLRVTRSRQRAGERFREEAGTDATPNPLASTADRVAVLDAALAELSDTERAVLVLTRFHELRYAEVAAVLGCTPAAARVRAHRAITHLRRLCLERERRGS